MKGVGDHAPIFSLSSLLPDPTHFPIYWGGNIVHIVPPQPPHRPFSYLLYTDFFFLKKSVYFNILKKIINLSGLLSLKKGRIITITQQQGVSHFLRPRKKNQLHENCHAVSVKKISQRLHKNIFNCMKVKRLVKNTISIAQTINLTVGQINDIDLK